MNQPTGVQRLRRAILALLLLGAFIPMSSPAAEPQRLFLPAVGSGGPRGILGLEIDARDPALPAAELAPGWVRRSGLRWRDIESIPGGGYNWDLPAVRELEAQLAAASRRGIRVILVLQGSPAWAVTPYQADCAPIAAEFRDEFARFAQAVASRYSAPPFNVRYFEIGNEPDAFVFSVDSPFGCWGRPDQELYGGEAYGELLKLAYPAIKAAAPTATVLHGGLLLDQPYNPQTGMGRSGRFLEGVLAAGAGNSFDVLAFHSYSFYDGTPDGTAGSVDWKPAYLRTILARHGLSKPLINTEGALLCPTSSDACTQAQGYAVSRLHVRSMRDGLLGAIWYIYDSDGFNHTALIDPVGGAVRPAGRAFLQSARALAGYQYDEQLADLPAGVEAHRLRHGDRTTVVIWANRPTAVTFELGAVTLRCAEWDGEPFLCGVDEAGRVALDAGPGPRYLRWVAP